MMPQGARRRMVKQNEHKPPLHRPTRLALRAPARPLTRAGGIPNHSSNSASVQPAARLSNRTYSGSRLCRKAHTPPGSPLTCQSSGQVFQIALVCPAPGGRFRCRRFPARGPGTPCGQSRQKSCSSSASYSRTAAMAGLLTAGQCAAKSSGVAPDAWLSYRACRGTPVPRKPGVRRFAPAPAPLACSAASLPSGYLSAMLVGRRRVARR